MFSPTLAALVNFVSHDQRNKFAKLHIITLDLIIQDKNETSTTNDV